VDVAPPSEDPGLGAAAKPGLVRPVQVQRDWSDIVCHDSVAEAAPVDVGEN